jgi:hypothetical protein
MVSAPVRPGERRAHRSRDRPGGSPGAWLSGAPNEQGQHNSMNADPVGWPQAPHRRSQQTQQMSLAIRGR